MRVSYLRNESKNKSPCFSLTKISAIGFLQRPVYMRAEAMSPLQEGIWGGAGAEVEVLLLRL